MKKFLTLLLTVALTAALAITGTMAYLTDTDSDVNVMTMGNVYIDQIEQERDVNGDLVDFTQAKPLLPAVYPGQSTSDSIPWADAADWAVAGDEAWKTVEGGAEKNVVDKFVTVENTGKSDAYVRTIIAYEGDPIKGTDIHIIQNAKDSSNTEVSSKFASTEYIENVVIDGVRYDVIVYTYAAPLAPGATTIPSLKQVYMDHTCGNEEVAKYGDTYEILVLSQAVQVDGFATATEAFEAAFPKGTDNANVAVWFGDAEIPAISAYEGVKYITTGTTAEIISAGGDTVERGILSEGLSDVTEVVVGEGITTLANRSLAKMPTLKSVSLPSTLTTLEEGALQGSAITEVEIPENVTYIGKQAIGYCPDIEKIVIKAKNVTIGNYVARACANLKEVYIYSDSVAFETGSMYFTNKENADASAITFYVKDQAMADNCYAAFSTSHSYGMLIKSLDGQTEFYNTLP